MTKPVIIAIDGLAGSGKSTTARRLAEELGFIALDSGSVYRIITLAMLLQNMTPGDQFAKWFLSHGPNAITLTNGAASHLFGKPVNMDTLKTTEIHNNVSQVSEHLDIREFVNKKMREQAELHVGIICDGRDAGTVIFPDADVKLYFTAVVTNRARRIGQTVSDVQARDKNDYAKAHGALPQPQTAIRLGYKIVRTDAKDPSAVTAIALRHIERTLPQQ